MAYILRNNVIKKTLTPKNKFNSSKEAMRGLNSWWWNIFSDFFLPRSSKDQQEVFEKQIYDQLSDQSNRISKPTLLNSEKTENISFIIDGAQQFVQIANINGDGSCMFAAITHQIERMKIDSPTHNEKTKSLREETVAKILKHSNSWSDREFLTSCIQRPARRLLYLQHLVNIWWMTTYRNQRFGEVLSQWWPYRKWNK